MKTFTFREMNWTRAHLEVLRMQQEITSAYINNDGKFEEVLEKHHMVMKSKGGSDKLSNLRLLHRICHIQITLEQRR